MKPCALVLVHDPKRGLILLVKRKDVPVWVMPGGGVDPGEEPIAAAFRELDEETGLKAKRLSLKGHFSPINKLTQETFVFVTTEVEGELTVTEETADSAYFPYDALPKALFPLHRRWIEKCLFSASTLREPIQEVTWRTFFAYAIRHPWIVLRFLWTVITKP
jgi:8-oxo-dGTP pyrophosphatase MutT (NUDIX family)